MPDRTCSIDDCERPAKKRGWCNMHYLRWIRHGSTDHPHPPISPDGLCVVEHCERSAVVRGLCQTHNRAWKLYQSFELPGSKPPFGAKWCRKCRTYRSLAEFYVGKKGPESPCKPCRSIREKRYRKQNPPRTRSDKNRRRRALERAARSEPYTAQEIAERDGWICRICGKRIGRKLRFPHPRSLSIDHIIPLGCGGDDVRVNVQAAHFGCNASKRTGGIDQLRLIG